MRHRGGGAHRARRGFVTVVAGLAAVVVVGVTVLAAAAQGSTTKACRPGGAVLARSHGVVIWHGVSRGHDQVYVCGPPHHRARVALRPSSVNPRVSVVKAWDVKVADHFVGFRLREIEHFRHCGDGGCGVISHSEQLLIVFNLGRGRTEFKDTARCSNPPTCINPLLEIDRYALARNGWAAEVDNSYTDGANIPALFATNDGRHHWPLDASASISQLTLSGGVLRWTSAEGGASSVALGPGATFPAVPVASAGGCQVLSAVDAAAMLGGPVNTIGSSVGQCVYASQANASSTVAIAVQTGLSAAQVSAAESQLGKNPNYRSLQVGFGDPVDGVQRFLADPAHVPTHDQLVEFARGTQVTIDLAPRRTNSDVLLLHAGTVALDRLFGVPIQRAM